MSETGVPNLLRQVKHALKLQQGFVLGVVSNFDGNAESKDVQRTLCMLYQYFLDRSGAVVALLTNRLDWDAEILLRTCYECAVKVLRIALAPPREQVELVEEFWGPLDESANRRAARKAVFAEAVFPETCQGPRDVFRLLRDPKVFPDGLGLTRGDRRRLEHKWSFSELIETLKEAPLGKVKIKDIRFLLHVYGMASHLVHADCKALDLITDRAQRGPDELTLLQDAHAARITTDLVSIGFLCTYASSNGLARPKGTHDDLLRQVDVVLSMAEEITNAFYASQRAFYDSMLPSRTS